MRQGVEPLGHQRCDGEGEQHAEPDEYQQRAEDAAPQFVVDVLVEEGEPEHVDRPGRESDDADHRHDDREVRRRRRDEESAAGEHQRHGEDGGPIDPVLEYGRGDDADRHPETEREEDEVEVRVVADDELVDVDRAQGDEHTAADHTDAETDVHRSHDRIHGDEAPALPQFAPGTAEVPAASFPTAPFLPRPHRERDRPDDQRGQQERDPVDVEGQSLLVEPPGVDPALIGQRLGHLREKRGDARRHREHPVGRGDVERVGGGQLLGRDDVGDDPPPSPATTAS